jgi:predicted TIM-barrel fold metal-dependent hydrolase
MSTSSLSRRDLLLGAAAAGAVPFARRTTSAFAKASQPGTPVGFDVPTGACDCHTHVFGDPGRFAFTPSRTYTPEPAPVEEMQTLHRALHMDRVVIVQPSVYGTDNACTLDAVRHLGARARAIVVIDEKTADGALDDMHRSGARGIRLNLETTGVTDPAAAGQRLQAAADRMRGRGWHIQIYTRLAVIQALRDQIAAMTVPVVFDHFGGAQAPLGTQQPGFDALTHLVRTGKAYVKISGAYRSSTRGPDYADAAPLAKALIAANPRRILWGTDWPHPDSSPVAGRKSTDVAPLLQIDDGRLLNQLPIWVAEAAQRKLILVDNPAQLYGF